MKNRQSSRSTRIDLRIPNDLLETIQKLASERFNAPIHHISGKPEITPVIIQLIQLGVGTLSGKHPDSSFDSTADNYPDNIVTVDRLETAIESLREELSGIGAIGDYLARLTAIENQISPIVDSHREIEALMGK